MKYTIYRVTNNINGKFYIGKHQTENPNDGYYGSGVALQRAIRKYGKENFYKEILFVFETEEEMNEKERELITEELINSEKCYNMMHGGEGGDTWTGTGRHHSERTKKIISESSKKTYQNMSPEKKKEISDKLKSYWKDLRENRKEEYASVVERRRKGLKKYIENHPEKYPMGHRQLSEETKIKISKSLQKYNRELGRKPVSYKKRELKTDKNVSKRMFVTKNGKDIIIFVEELDWYINDGWKIGRSDILKNKIREIVTKISEKNDNMVGRGKIYVSKNGIRKRIDKNELEIFIKDGWSRGY